jgi:hypothetical protein
MAFRSVDVDRDIVAPGACQRLAGRRGTWTVVPETGKGDLTGIVGNGRWKAGPGPQATFELTYQVG